MSHSTLSVPLNPDVSSNMERSNSLTSSISSRTTSLTTSDARRMVQMLSQSRTYSNNDSNGLPEDNDMMMCGFINDLPKDDPKKASDKALKEYALNQPTRQYFERCSAMSCNFDQQCREKIPMYDVRKLRESLWGNLEVSHLKLLMCIH